MDTLKGFPFFGIEFDKKGQVFDPDQVKALTKFLAKGEVTDLLVISHGWNNDMKDAKDLYTRFFDCARQVLDSGAVAGMDKRKFAILGVLWPSAKFADKELIASGAAGLGSSVSNDLLREQLDDMKAIFNTAKARKTLEDAKKLVPKLEDSKKARTEFADLLRSLLPKTTSPDVDAADAFSKLSGEDVIQRLSKPVPITAPKAQTGGGAAFIGGASTMSPGGGAAGLTQMFSGIKMGAYNLLNLTTYYQMKERAGLVGSIGLNEILRSIRSKNPEIKLHLIGHSFGGRLVTAAVAGADDKSAVKVDTLTLLQTAFSHYGFSKDYDGTNDGLFRRVITGKSVAGPTLISCTPNDKAVGMAYPLASLLAGQVAASLGDENDKYGGLGRNGAQKTPEASDGTLLDVGAAYHFQAGRLHNLHADAIIKGHSDICHNEIAYALFNAIALT